MFFRADFNITSVGNEDFKCSIGRETSEFFRYDNDDDALYYAKWLAEKGTYYADVGHCGLELTYLVEVDEDTETFEEKRVIYY